ncbi:MAG: hydrogenase maturation protease [Candidatus Thorarchaeota archaeon]
MKNPSNPTEEIDVAYMRLRRDLTEFLAGGRRIVVVGIGNDLRCDDGLGPFIVSGLTTRDPRLMMWSAGSVFEALADPLLEFEADRVIIIDAADLHRPVGYAELIGSDKIGTVTTTSHGMPLSLLMMYLEQRTAAKVVLLGVQPACVDFAEGLTEPIRQAAGRLICMIDDVLRAHLEASPIV